MTKDLSSLPSVDQLLRSVEGQQLVKNYGHQAVVDVFRRLLQGSRKQFLDKQLPLPTEVEIVHRAEEELNQRLNPTLFPVINAAGVIVHTNLGRAPLSKETREVIFRISEGYSTLEYDISTGGRGSRLIHAETLFTELLGVESALIVNNNASAVLLMLTVLTRGKKVIISRSQLVEIGGGFRIPDVLRHSGTELVEVGTTNKVHLYDYQRAFQEDTAAVMRAHSSNFAIVGFTSQPDLTELVSAAHQADVMFFDDLGSGALLDTSQYGLKAEPMVQDSVAAGADLICFSGDKLLGGPQAGIIIGRRDLISRLKSHPLARAIRPDKMALAGLATTLTHYLKGEALEKIPVWQMISMDLKIIEKRVQSWIKETGLGEMAESESMVGGGSLPGETLPTRVWSLKPQHPQRLAEGLRMGELPVIARIEDDRVVLDPRTVLLDQDDHLVQKVNQVWRDNES